MIFWIDNQRGYFQLIRMEAVKRGPTDPITKVATPMAAPPNAPTFFQRHHTGDPLISSPVDSQDIPCRHMRKCGNHTHQTSTKVNKINKTNRQNNDNIAAWRRLDIISSSTHIIIEGVMAIIMVETVTPTLAGRFFRPLFSDLLISPSFENFIYVVDDAFPMTKEGSQTWTVHDFGQSIGHLCRTMYPFDLYAFSQTVFDNQSFQGGSIFLGLRNGGFLNEVKQAFTVHNCVWYRTAFETAFGILPFFRRSANPRPVDAQPTEQVNCSTQCISFGRQSTTYHSSDFLGVPQKLWKKMLLRQRTLKLIKSTIQSGSNSWRP